MSNKDQTAISQQVAMLTRHKSSLMQRRLRNKDRTMQHLTQVLQTRKPHKKLVKNTYVDRKILLNRLMEKKSTDKTEEYFPNKLKRDVKVKKVKLKPRSNFMKVGGINKRKLFGPHKDIIKEPHPTSDMSSQTESLHKISLTMSDLVSLAEESNDLTDEDLVEILTCPSPVWWEDCPGLEFLEEPIIHSSKSDDDDDSESPQPVVQEIKIQHKSEVFVKKRSALESLLSNIKQKVPKIDESKAVKKTDNPKRIITKDSVVKTKSKRKNMIELQSIEVEEDVLKSLQNIHIPMDTSEVDCFDSPNDCVIVDNEIDNAIAELTKQHVCKDNKTTSATQRNQHWNIIDTRNARINKEKHIIKDDNTRSNVNLNQDSVSENDINIGKDSQNDSLQTLIFTDSNGQKKIVNIIDDQDNIDDSNEPDSSPSVTIISSLSTNKEDEPDDVTVVSSQEIDTISDTDIHFINDDQVSETNSEKSSKDYKKFSKFDLRATYLQLTQKEERVNDGNKTDSKRIEEIEVDTEEYVVHRIIDDEK